MTYYNLSRIEDIFYDPSSASQEEVKNMAEGLSRFVRGSGKPDLRDTFAMAAFQCIPLDSPERLAEMSYKIAECMLNERKKRNV